MATNRKFKKAEHSKTPLASEIVYKANEAISKGNVLYVAGVDGGFHRLGKADKDTAAKARTTLYFALHDVPSGQHGRAALFGVIEGVDTSGSTIGNPVFLSASGGVTLTKPMSGDVRVVGSVAKVSATAGEVDFNGATVTISRPHAGLVIAVTKATAGAAGLLDERHRRQLRWQAGRRGAPDHRRDCHVDQQGSVERLGAGDRPFQRNLHGRGHGRALRGSVRGLMHGDLHAG